MHHFVSDPGRKPANSPFLNRLVEMFLGDHSPPWCHTLAERRWPETELALVRADDRLS